jgi:hypothetical protein
MDRKSKSVLFWSSKLFQLFKFIFLLGFFSISISIAKKLHLKMASNMEKLWMKLVCRGMSADWRKL